MPVITWTAGTSTAVHARGVGMVVVLHLDAHALDAMRTAKTRRGAGRIDLDAMLSRAADAVFAVDAGGRIRFWNHAAAKLVGYTTGEVIGRPCCEAFGPDPSHGETLCYRGCHATPIRLGDPVQNFDLRTRTKTDRPIRVNVSVLAIVGPSRRRAVSLHVLRARTVSARPVVASPEHVGEPALTPSAERAPLTRRELEVLRLLAAGMNTRRLAETLRVSTATVRNHAQSIMQKLGVHSRLAAVAVAHSHRLV